MASSVFSTQARARSLWDETLRAKRTEEISNHRIVALVPFGIFLGPWTCRLRRRTE
jgi:hypothetical protein